MSDAGETGVDRDPEWRDEAGVLQFLNATAATLSSTHDVVSLLQAVIDAATPAAGAAFGAIFFQDAPAEALGEVPSLARHGRPLIALSNVCKTGEGEFDPAHTAAAFAGAWHARRAVRCGDVTQPVPAQGQAALPPGLEDQEPTLRSFLAVPIGKPSGEVMGGLFFGHPDKDVFDERTQRIVEGVAAHAAVALENARLLDGLRRTSVEHERLARAERRARAESARAARIKDEFLATLSHELRTPLTAILGWAQVLLQRDDPVMRARGLQAIARNANMQARLIEDLLDMSRIVSGKVQLDMRATDLAQVVPQSLASLQATATAKGVELAQRVAPEAAWIPGDALRLGQIVWSLASNAIEFTPRGGRVEVTVERVGSEVEIAVTDTGTGIDAAFLPHVFEQFRQADGSTTRRHGGLGLGLAVVRTLATLHGGSAAASSDGVGHGARFVVRLPATAVDPGHAPASAEARRDESPQDRSARPEAASERHVVPAFSDTDLGGLDVLVVDDETDAREFVAQLLLECGATVRQAADATDAMRAFASHPPDVLVSDIGMPGWDGYELMREIRRLEPAQGGSVPALALTAFVRPEDRERTCEAGFQAHLPKPVEPDVLVAAVVRLAGRGMAGRPQ